jgi:hypothetical protein
MTNREGTIGDTVRNLLSRKRPLTYDQILETVKERHPGAATSKDSVQWYASRMRAEGLEPHVKSA